MEANPLLQQMMKVSYCFESRDWTLNQILKLLFSFQDPLFEINSDFFKKLTKIKTFPVEKIIIIKEIQGRGEGTMESKYKNLSNTLVGDPYFYHRQ